MGVIGPSGSGKSTLARALAGIWPVAAGTLRRDGIPLDRHDPDRLGRATGYLPQRVTLFPGSIADNIARLDPSAGRRPDPWPDSWPDSWPDGIPDGQRRDAAVVAAARKAGAHEMILALPRGYDTPVAADGLWGSGPGAGPAASPSGGIGFSEVGFSGVGLSGGQLQRIGLARALYGDPAVVILDEPNAHLDNDGAMALNRALRALKAEGRTVFIMAHRPAALQECDLLLVLDAGRGRAFGPRDKVLQEMLQNGSGVVRRLAAGQAS